MIINLFDVGDAVREFKFTLAPDEIDLKRENTKLTADAIISGGLKKGIAQVDVSGEIKAQIETECARCLQPAAENLNFSFEAVFVAPEDLSQDREVELSQSDLNVSIIDDDKIDLKEVAREQIILNLPDQAFCREDCQGLCDQCGANRNVVNCKCRENNIDPRWSALRDLKK